jgi:hypothetical protein
MFRLWMLAGTLLFCAAEATAQRVTSLGLAVGPTSGDRLEPTAAFTASVGFDLQFQWLLALYRSVGEHSTSPAGTQRDVSVALMMTAPLGSRVLVGAGPSVHALREDGVDGRHERKTKLGVASMAGWHVPIAGPGIALELAGRVDHFAGQITLAALFGVRVHPGSPNTLRLGEPPVPPQVPSRATAWNDVLMQLILLEQELDSFTRIREIETGVELQFEQGSVTLYDDVAHLAAVLNAADPPVRVTVFGPNAARVAAALTSASFPQQRTRIESGSRVFLRVEH